MSAGEVRNLAGALQMRKATKGVLVTTSSFTKDAADTARQIGSIVLVNGAQLAQLMIKYDLGVATEVVYPVKKVDQDVFDEWSCSAAASDVRCVDSDRFWEEVMTGVVGRCAELWMVSGALR